jgi:hypothetical protein
MSFMYGQPKSGNHGKHSGQAINKHHHGVALSRADFLPHGTLLAKMGSTKHGHGVLGSSIKPTGHSDGATPQHWEKKGHDLMSSIFTKH